MENTILTEIYKELRQRGYDIDLMEILSVIVQQTRYQTSIQFLSNDDESLKCAKIASNRIEMDNELTLAQKLLICNHFNKNVDYCSAYLSDDDNELFMVSTYVSINCENFVEICADMFEEVINATEFLVDLIIEY